MAGLSLLLGACSSADQQRTAEKTARSVLAEWGAVDRLGEANRIPRTYRTEMRSEAQKEIASAASSLRNPVVAHQLSAAEKNLEAQ
jgi:hypothetical protein